MTTSARTTASRVPSGSTFGPRWFARIVLGCGLPLVLVTGCGSGGSEESPGPSDVSASVSEPATSEPADQSPTASSSSDDSGSLQGCAATDDGTPSGAGTAKVIDVDGDGADDLAWITAGADRRFGITTQSGATFSIAIDSASPIRASAVVNVVGESDTPTALVDDGRAVHVFSVSDCDLHVVQNKDGAPYTFDKGFTGYGTGVGCIADDGALHLAGLNAEADSNGEKFKVTRTLVDLSSDGMQAINGEPKVVAEDASADDPVVTTAQETTCGDFTAGEHGPLEPEE